MKSMKMAHEPIWIDSWHIQEMYDLQIDECIDRVLGYAEEGVRERYHYGVGGIDHYDLAAVYGFKIARDGNHKALATIAVRAFLHTNGVTYAARSSEEKEAIAGVANGKTNEEEFAAWLRRKGRNN